jgi:uncharacterized protein DUF6976
MNELISIAAAAELIRSGAVLGIAGAEAALDRLPAGTWIGGTTPYFMLVDGGKVVDDEHVFVTDLERFGSTVRIAAYAPEALADITRNAPDNGFALTIIPAGGRAHAEYAANAANYPDAFLKPTVGWISGVHLSDLGRVTPKVYDGRTVRKLADHAVVAYVALPAEALVSVEIANLFEPDGQDVLRFDETTFQVARCTVNGQPADFAQYLRRRGVDDGKLPLVGDFAGAHVNVSLQGIDDERGVVNLYAPVFPGVDYCFAKPVADYAAAFRSRLAAVDSAGVVMGCNCILNFLFGGLEGRAIGGVSGPVTFGEIAYQLLNQTMVMVRVH